MIKNIRLFAVSSKADLTIFIPVGNTLPDLLVIDNFMTSSYKHYIWFKLY
jgi:hypothetical protein